MTNHQRICNRNFLPFNTFRVYTGPTLVHSVANRLREDPNIIVSVEGTEHIIVKTTYVTCILLSALGITWKTSDVQLLGYEDATGYHHMY